MRLWRILLLGLFLISNLALAEPGLVRVISGNSEAVGGSYYDEQSGLIFVSTMGPGGARDGKGAISILRPDGVLLKRDWISGLNSPRGVFVILNRLLVAEKDSITVVTFTFRAREPIPVITNSYQLRVAVIDGQQARKAQLLNDVVATIGGDVYVTDTFGGRIYRITGLFAQSNSGVAPAGVNIEEFAQGLQLLSPSGIALQGSKLWVVGSDTFTGLGNFVSQQTPFGLANGDPDPEKPLPWTSNILRALDPFDPPPFNDPKAPRSVNVANSFSKTHHGKLYSIETTSRRKIEMFSEPDGAFYGVAVDSAGGVLVGDYDKGEILKIDPSTGSWAKLLTLPSLGEPLHPTHISVHPTRGTMYIPVTTGEIYVYESPR